MKLEAVIFDLDGVIVSTDECHFEAWKQLADEEGIEFNRMINQRLRGVSRMESLEIILEKAAAVYSDDVKIQLATRKNHYYQELIQKLTPDDMLPGVMDFLEGLKKKNIKVAIGSSSRNSPLILERIGLHTYFDATSDGNNIKKSKPDPEVFLLAAEWLHTPPENCFVVEDADAGVQAALAGGMRVLGVGSAAQNKQATLHAPDLSAITAADFLARCNAL